VLAEDGDLLLSHAAVIRRTLEIDGEPWDTGYVEAVASDPAHQGKGIGTRVMEVVGDIIHEEHQLGALGTGSFHFYERLGWRRWRGQSGVRTPAGIQQTPDDDRFIMVLLTPMTAGIDLSGFITCNWRQGDVW
jgi:aminoglycoside 2'-N-acetyltransferase I